MIASTEGAPAGHAWVWNETGRGHGLAHLPDCGQLVRLARKAERTGQPVRVLPPLPDPLPEGTPICAHCARRAGRADQDYDHAEQVFQERQKARAAGTFSRGARP